MHSDKATEMFDAVVFLMRARKNTEIRASLRKLGALTGYGSVPGEDSKVAAVKDWTKDIAPKFLK